MKAEFASADGRHARPPSWLLRVALIPPSVILVCFLCFLGLRLAPGGPFAMEQGMGAEQRERLVQAFGLDRRWDEQWWQWLSEAIHGNFGESWHHRGVAVHDLLASGWAVSLQLGASALLVGVACGLTVAVAVMRDGRLVSRRLADITVDLLLCLPGFLLGPVLLVLAQVCGVLSSQRTEPDSIGPSSLLPGLALAVPVAAATVRWALLGLEQAREAPWWRAVQARGISERRLWWRYGMGAARPVLLAGLGPIAADLLAGAVAVETFTGLPGLGRRLAEAAIHRDVPLLLGAVACSLVTVMLVQTALDHWRWRLETRAAGRASR